MKKEEMKQWVKEHKKDILISIAYAACITGFGYSCYKIGESRAIPWTGAAKDLIKENINAHSKGEHGLSSIIATEGIPLKDMGCIYDGLTSRGVPEDAVYRSVLLISEKPYKM